MIYDLTSTGIPMKVKRAKRDAMGIPPVFSVGFPGQRQKEAQTSGRVWTEDLGDFAEESTKAGRWSRHGHVMEPSIQWSWMTMTSLLYLVPSGELT